MAEAGRHGGSYLGVNALIAGSAGAAMTLERGVDRHPAPPPPRCGIPPVWAQERWIAGGRVPSVGSKIARRAVMTQMFHQMKRHRR